MSFEKKNSKGYLLDLINQLTDETCIITHHREHDSFIPALFRKELKYQIYMNMYSPWEEYEDVTDLIDRFFSYITDKDDYYFTIESVEYFNQRRRQSIENSVRVKEENGGDENYNTIRKELEQWGGTYVIAPSQHVKYLIAACESDEDYYYVYLQQINGNIQLSMESCVGKNVGLLNVLPKEDYEAVNDYLLDEALETRDAATNEYGVHIIYKKLKEEFDNVSEYILITPIYLLEKEYIKNLE